MRWALLLLLTSCEEAHAPQVGSACEADSIDVLHHDVHLTIALDRATLHGEGELRLRARDATRVISLDVGELVIARATLGGRALPARRVDDRLCLELPRALAPSEETTLALAWEAPKNARGLHFSPNGAWAGYDTPAWMPTRQGPAQRATLTLDVNAGPRAKVVGTTHVDRPTPPFLFAFAVGSFEEAVREEASLDLRVYGPPGSDLQKALSVTAPMVRFFESHLGGTLGRYRQVFVPGEAAQEAFGMALLGQGTFEDLRTDPHEDWIFSHELAHQWFAVRVPCADFSDFWLNEGFATFMVAAVKEATWGRAAYDREVKLWRERSAKAHATGKDAPVATKTTGLPESKLQARAITYSRGALVLHRLREELGDAVFWTSLRQYVSDRTGKPTRTADLRHSLESASGLDLKPFFDRWVYAVAPDL